MVSARSSHRSTIMIIKEQVIREIENLPDESLEEVFDFIKFLELRKSHLSLIEASRNLSQSVFQAVWDNEEDSVYDSL